MVHAKRRKRSKKKDKRAALLTAAIDVFGKKGYVKANISDVAEAAGVASGTVYLYFKNKDDLLLQAMQQMMDINLKQIKKQLAGTKLAVDKLFMFFYYHVEVFTHNPSMARFLMVELRQSDEFYKRYPTYNPYHDYKETVLELITKSIQEGTTKAYNPETLAYLILGAMDTVVTQWVIHPESVNLEAVTHEMRDILHNGMKTD
jgi:TetR/AcrR family fatty acid metabolism transcriptional regulator